MLTGRPDFVNCRLELAVDCEHMAFLHPVEHVLVPIPAQHVLIPVPRHRIDEVMALLDKPPGQNRSSGGPGEATTETNERGGSADERWSAEDLAALVHKNDALHPKQAAFLELLAERPSEQVYTSEARQRLMERGLVANPKYAGKTLGGVVLSLKRRAAWYSDSRLFDEGWDEAGGWYVLPEEHAAVLRPLLVDYHAGSSR